MGELSAARSCQTRAFRSWDSRLSTHGRFHDSRDFPHVSGHCFDARRVYSRVGVAGRARPVDPLPGGGARFGRSRENDRGFQKRGTADDRRLVCDRRGAGAIRGNRSDRQAAAEAALGKHALGDPGVFQCGGVLQRVDEQHRDRRHFAARHARLRAVQGYRGLALVDAAFLRVDPGWHVHAHRHIDEPVGERSAAGS